jgi:hypothetical protein
VAVRRRAERQGAGGDEHADVVVVGSGSGGSVLDVRTDVSTPGLRTVDGAETSPRRVLTTYGS